MNTGLSVTWLNSRYPQRGRRGSRAHIRHERAPVRRWATPAMPDRPDLRVSSDQRRPSRSRAERRECARSPWVHLVTQRAFEQCIERQDCSCRASRGLASAMRAKSSGWVVRSLRLWPGDGSGDARLVSSVKVAVSRER
jgi:hypothetical protein